VVSAGRGRGAAGEPGWALAQAFYRTGDQIPDWIHATVQEADRILRERSSGAKKHARALLVENDVLEERCSNLSAQVRAKDDELAQMQACVNQLAAQSKRLEERLAMAESGRDDAEARAAAMGSAYHDATRRADEERAARDLERATRFTPLRASMLQPGGPLSPILKRFCRFRDWPSLWAFFCVVCNMMGTVHEGMAYNLFYWRGAKHAQARREAARVGAAALADAPAQAAPPAQSSSGPAARTGDAPGSEGRHPAGSAFPIAHAALLELAPVEAGALADAYMVDWDKKDLPPAHAPAIIDPVEHAPAGDPTSSAAEPPAQDAPREGAGGWHGLNPKDPGGTGLRPMDCLFMTLMMFRSGLQPCSGRPWPCSSACRCPWLPPPPRRG